MGNLQNEDQVSLKSDSFWIGAPDQSKLHLVRVHLNDDCPAVLCVHGAFDSGRVFYNKKFSRGLAPFLAKNGFDVFIGDLRGHGESFPKVSNNSEFGMHENIREDIPLFLKKIWSLKGHDCPISIVTHSDGGVLFYSSFAFAEGFQGKIDKVVMFGAKRTISAINIKKFIAVDIIWYRLVPLILRLKGYMPAKSLRIGSENDTRSFTEQRTKWLKKSDWIDPVDNFNYREPLKSLKKPKSYFVASYNDPYLGHTKDVKKFKEEISNEEDELMVLAKKNGNLHDYDHVSMLTHKDASLDHFPKIVEWLKK